MIACARWAASPVNRALAARTASSLVTTPIFYINGDAHIGHLYSALLADAGARAMKLRGSNVVLSTGTDEHGLKVYEAANRAGSSLETYCNEASSSFRSCFEAFNIGFDEYVRTTDLDHRDTVLWLWKRLQDRGYLYEGEYRGWYCRSDEAFLTDRQVGPSTTPAAAAAATAAEEQVQDKMISLESGHEVELLTEPNWMFRLSAFREPLREWLESSPNAIQPPSRRAEVAAMLNDDSSFSDLSVSRPVSRVPWGLPAPPPPSMPDAPQTIYVWLDALANYLTVAGGPKAVEAAEDGELVLTPDALQEQVLAQARGSVSGIRWDMTPDTKRGACWPPTVHVVGKDIMRFHCIYWPAFLLAAGLALPEQILIHGHFMVEGRKMSKSLGNVLDPRKLLQAPAAETEAEAEAKTACKEWCPPVDSVRWALLARGCLGGDGDFSMEQLEALWSSHIADGVGNLAARVTGKALLPEPFIPNPAHGWDAAQDGECLSRVAALGSEALQHFERLQMNHATSSINEASAHLNAYFTAMTPWKLTPGKPGADADRLAAILFTTLEGLRILGVAMQPAIPSSAKALLDALAVPVVHRASCKVWLPHDAASTPDAWLLARVGTLLPLAASKGKRTPLVLFSKPPKASATLQEL